MRSAKQVLGALVLSGMLGLVGCKKSTPAPEPKKPAAPAVEPLLALPTPKFDAARAELGKRLFHDPTLSGDNTVACASCHSLDTGGAEHRKSSLGIRGQVGPINAPTVLNSSLNFVQFWDGRAKDLIEQAGGPVVNPLEMGAEWPKVIDKLSADARYRESFAKLFPNGGLNRDNVLVAIAEYETSLATPSRFDRYLSGDTKAITDEEKKGHEMFKQLGCTGCHTGAGIGGTMYQRMGLVKDYFKDRGALTDADNGRFNVTHVEDDRHKFKVPLLRNVALTAPYLHDGSQATLPEVVRVMGKYQLGLELKDDQVNALVAFLNSLTGEIPASARMSAPDPAQPEASADAGANNDAGAAAQSTDAQAAATPSSDAETDASSDDDEDAAAHD